MRLPFPFPLGLLHVRGGVSRPRLQSLNVSAVFSTSVEVFPMKRGDFLSQIGLLHVRGGVSEQTDKGGFLIESSPRPWRCFYL